MPCPETHGSCLLLELLTSQWNISTGDVGWSDTLIWLTCCLPEDVTWFRAVAPKPFGLLTLSHCWGGGLLIVIGISKANGNEFILMTSPLKTGSPSGALEWFGEIGQFQATVMLCSLKTHIELSQLLVTICTCGSPALAGMVWQVFVICNLSGSWCWHEPPCWGLDAVGNTHCASWTFMDWGSVAHWTRADTLDS